MKLLTLISALLFSSSALAVPPPMVAQQAIFDNYKAATCAPDSGFDCTYQDIGFIKVRLAGTSEEPVFVTRFLVNDEREKMRAFSNSRATPGDKLIGRLRRDKDRLDYAHASCKVAGGFCAAALSIALSGAPHLYLLVSVFVLVVPLLVILG